MDIVDVDLEKAARDASPKRFSNYPEPVATEPVATEPQIETVLEHETPRRTSTTSSSTSSGSLVSGRSGNISRVPTQPMQPMSALERNETALSRIHTQRTQHSATVGKGLKSRESRKPLPVFGANKPYPPPLPEREEYVVEFDGEHDPLHAQNWPLNKKLWISAILGFATFIATFASSVFSTSIYVIGKQYSVSPEVSLLGLSLYILGFATGPSLWAPTSELRGRRLPLTVSMFGFSLFSLAVATAKDLQTILICRFWAGFFAACPISVVPAVFSDMYSNSSRGLAITVFSMIVFAGPLMAPFIGGFITSSYLGWRWTQYISSIVGFASFGLLVLFLKETYPPVILIEKAAELRRRTKNWGIHAKQEEIEVEYRELVTKNFLRPMRILFTEPIVLLITIYMSFIYGLLYLFLTAYPIAFQQIRGFNPGVGGLPFFGMIAGYFLSGFYIVLTQPSYNRKLKANNNVSVPEWRLPPVIIGGVAFAIGLFWFGWTGYRKEIHWIAPTLSGLFTGFGILSIFLQSLNYLVDAYLMFAASAIAGNTFLRSLAGAGFPLFATYMFDGLGLQWTLTLLGCVAALLVPIPVIFYVYGARIRTRSKFAPTAPKAEELVSE